MVSIIIFIDKVNELSKLTHFGGENFDLMTTVNVQDQHAVHPPVLDITQLLSFRLARFTAINDRNGHDWTMTYFGLRLNEWRVLGLTCAFEPIQFRDVARLLLMDKGQLSRTIKSLTDRGYLTTQVAVEDARSIEICATEKGRELHDRMLPFSKSRNDIVVEVLSSEECSAFMRILQKLTAHNEMLLQGSEQVR